MEALMALAIGVLTALGIYLLLRARTYPVILGVMMLSYAVNLFLLSMGRISTTAPPILVEGVAAYADPLPQALILTAIVIGFGMAAFIIVLSLRARIALGTDHVDGREPGDPHDEIADTRATGRGLRGRPAERRGVERQR